MPGTAIVLGPFTGGLNTASDPAAVQDADLTIFQNMELDLDGGLVSRPPILDTGGTFPITGEGSIKVLGFFTSTTGTNYLIASDGVSSTYYYSGTAWVLITNALSANAMCQFRDKAWLIAAPNTTQNGGSWSPSAGFAAVVGMPRGATIVSNKERLWVAPGKGTSADGAKLTYSGVGEPNRWPNTANPSGGEINISAGDGENIVNVVVYYSDILIFKERSTYRFSYTASPDAGQVTRLSATVGSAGQFCIGEYENSLYVLYDSKVFRLQNWNFERINIKVPLVATDPGIARVEPYALSVWGDRLIISFHDGTYVYSPRTDTWSTWKSDVVGPIGRVVSVPVAQGARPFGYVYSSVKKSAKMYSITTDRDVVGEPMDCIVRTKTFDYQAPQQFKRLYYWGANMIAKAPVTGIASPIAYATSFTWGQAKLRTWGAARAFTWGRPIDSDLQIVDPVGISTLDGERKYIKFLKSLRFRQIYFEIRFQTTGTISDSPSKLFTLTTFVAAKEIVPKKVN